MKINIKGAIIKNNNKWVYDWLEMDSTCPRDIVKALEEAKGEEIEVEINSGGGDVYSGSEIYSALKGYKGNTVGKIVGIAGSAASIIAMGVKKLCMAPTAQIMIHKASAYCGGNHKMLEKEADVLKSHDVGIANAYMLKTGMTQKNILEMMDKETWMDAKTALENGFVDEIMFDEGLSLCASVDSTNVHSAILADELINKIRNKILVENREVKLEPVSDIKPETEPKAKPEPKIDEKIKAQQEQFRKLKLKIMGGIQ